MTDFVESLIISDEAHFELRGYVNTQKKVLRSSTKGIYTVDVSQCDVSFLELESLGRIFSASSDASVAVFNEKYQEKMSNFFAPKLRNVDQKIRPGFNKMEQLHTTYASVSFLKALMSLNSQFEDVPLSTLNHLSAATPV
jgi:hypothetical protein